MFLGSPQPKNQFEVPGERIFTRLMKDRQRCTWPGHPWALKTILVNLGKGGATVLVMMTN